MLVMNILRIECKWKGASCTQSFLLRVFNFVDHVLRRVLNIIFSHDRVLLQKLMCHLSRKVMIHSKLVNETSMFCKWIS